MEERDGGLEVDVRYLGVGVFSVTQQLEHHEYSFDEALHRASFGRYQIYVLAVLSLALFADIAEENLSFIIGPHLLCEWNLSGLQEAFIATAAFMGMFCGAYFWGKISDEYGRKAALMAICIWTAYYGIISAISPSYGWFIFLRFMTGFGIGGIHVVTTFAAEIVETKQRAKSMLVLHLISGLAPIYTAGLAYVFVNNMNAGWRILVFMCSMPQFVCFVIGIFLLDESPRFLLVTGQTNRAKWILTKMSAYNRADLLFGDIKAIHATQRGRLSALFSSRLLTKLTICQFIIWFCLMSCNFGMGLLFAESLQASNSARHISFDSGSSCFASSEVSYCRAQCYSLTTRDYGLILVTHGNLIMAAFISMFLSDMFGRVRLIFGCVFTYCVSLSVLYFCINPVFSVIIVLICKVALSASIQAFYLYLCEAYPTNMRSVAIGTGTSFGRMGMIMTPFIAQVLAKTDFTLAITTYLFLGSILLVALWLLPFDTRNKQIKDS